jgi:RNA polymerase sigma factor (sigma-70 family)
MKDTINVVIVCPNRLLRESLSLELSQQTCMTVVHSVAEVIHLPCEVLKGRPNVIIIDFSSLKRNRLGNTQRFRDQYPEAKLLVIGLSESESDLLECIEAGALGCLSMEASLKDLHNHIQAVASGGALCSPTVAKFLFTVVTENAVEREKLRALTLTQLTRREREVIVLIEEGLSNKEIAGHLNIEMQTVKNHVHNILEKLQLCNRREAAKYAREEGLIRFSGRVLVN